MFLTKKKNTVNIVAQKDSWILEKLARQLDDVLPYTIWSGVPTGKSDVTYYINYVQAGRTKASKVECALFTHYEERDSTLSNKWWQVAGQVEVAVCMSEMYSKMLSKRKITTKLIPPGVDLEKYTPRNIKIGVVGTTKVTGRKGEDIIKSIMDIPGIELSFTGGTGWPADGNFIPENDMPNFYRGLDYVLIASYYEGGPMCAIEALACGIPVIAPAVGWVPELPHIKFDRGNKADLRRVLLSIVNDKNKLRESVIERSWDEYIRKHDMLFKELLIMAQ